MARNTVKVGLVSVAGILLAGSAAHAAPQNWTSIGNTGIGNGIQAYAPIQVPVSVCGNAIGLIGGANANCTGGATAHLGEGAFAQNWTTALNTGIANGDQIQTIVQVPVDVCGNAISLLGDSSAWCQGGSTATISDDERPAPRPAPYAHLGGKATAHHAAQRPGHNRKTEGLPLLGDGLTGLTGGLRTLLGQENSLPMDALIGQAPVTNRQAGGSCSINWFTSGNTGVLNGVQALVPVQVPVDISGNAVGVIGGATAGSVGGASADLC
ncbi:hypothetical protein F4553_004422 [Allocatelliglobosispora scoriae]|uniref:Chaplin domain-containing protein n=1 Tax=Allocatelliglobosispora scoriae TaxID=643052 RepID=A0A841BVU6_9ACTN|nr:chaplin family protein [Allocatelliglobosispora scoriae]MBB5871043.1 hypothetical protein [Allocatelliglobosispora scoriae]